MPGDSSRSRATTTKPLTPALSSNLRTRPPLGLTPRLAGNGPMSPATQSQRILRQQTLSPDRPVEAAAPSLNSNITPRSGARVSRLDTDSPSTPDTATRARVLAAGAAGDTAPASYGLGITSPASTPTQTRPKSTEQLSFLPTANGRRISAGSSPGSVKDDSKFFRANDANTPSWPKAIGPKPKSTYTAQPQRSLTSPRNAHDATAPPEEKFFYANNAPSAQVGRNIKSPLANRPLQRSAAASSTHSLPIQLPSASPSTARPPAVQQAVSGPDHLLCQPASHKGTHLTKTTSPIKSGSIGNPCPDRRRSSSLNVRPVLSGVANSHRKSLSTSSSTIVSSVGGEISSTDIQGSQALQLTSPSLILSQPVTDATSPSTPRSSSLNSAQTITTSNTSNASIAETLSNKAALSIRHTRGSSETTALQPITKEQIEAANNARRERKVLDLEISNSSLLAINKMLEKEMRKQSAELRRFRRLSRSGRLSLAPSNRIVSNASMATLDTLDEVDNDASQLSLSPTNTDSGSPDDEDDSASGDDSSYIASSDMLRKRARDEKRLLQDLQRHQQILLDSQKLTQSIQRCLNCTDELIKDGNKALAYQVEERDVQVGGRVLNHDDDEALSEVDFGEYQETMTRPRQALLSPSVTKDELEEAAMWANAIPQTLDEPREQAIPLTDKPPTDSPSPTLEFSPILLPDR